MLLQLDAIFFALAVPAVIFAGVSKAGFGSGAAFAATPLLALVVDPVLAVGFMLPLLMVMDVASLRPYWKRWDAPSARLLILGGVPGVMLGALVWSAVDAGVLRLLIGAVALGFVAFQTSRALGWLRLASRPVGPVAGVVAGLVSGFTSFVSHAGGPPAAVYMLLRGLDKTRYQATSVIVFWALNLVKLVPFVWLGMITGQTLLAGLLLVPFALFGAWLGVRAHAWISPRAFFGATYVLLTMTGVKLVWDGLAG